MNTHLENSIAPPSPPSSSAASAATPSITPTSSPVVASLRASPAPSVPAGLFPLLLILHEVDDLVRHP